MAEKRVQAFLQSDEAEVEKELGRRLKDVLLDGKAAAELATAVETSDCPDAAKRTGLCWNWVV
eukprot:6476534-Amphidinium_carterae.1